MLSAEDVELSVEEDFAGVIAFCRDVFEGGGGVGMVVLHKTDGTTRVARHDGSLLSIDGYRSEAELVRERAVRRRGPIESDLTV